MKNTNSFNKFVRAGLVLFIISTLSTGSLLLTGCPEVQTACQVVKAVDTACTMVEIIGDDGKTQQVPVAAEDMRNLARRTAAARRLDAGVDNHDGG